MTVSIKDFAGISGISTDTFRKAFSDAGLSNFRVDMELTPEIIKAVTLVRKKWAGRFDSVTVTEKHDTETPATIPPEISAPVPTIPEKKRRIPSINNNGISTPVTEISEPAKTGWQTTKEKMAWLVSDISVMQGVLYFHSALLLYHLHIIYPVGNSGLVLGIMAGLFIHVCVRLSLNPEKNRTSENARNIAFFIFIASGWVHFLGFSGIDGTAARIMLDTPEQVMKFRTNIGLSVFAVFISFSCLYLLRDFKLS
jgi:hypothetical protein